jgi:hypothetical protein
LTGHREREVENSRNVPLFFKIRGTVAAPRSKTDISPATKSLTVVFPAREKTWRGFVLKIYKHKTTGKYFILLKKGCFVGPDGEIDRIDTDFSGPDPTMEIDDDSTNMNALTPVQLEKYRMHSKKENSVDVIAACLIQIFGKEGALNHIENIRKKMNLVNNEFIDDIERELNNEKN